MNRRFLLRCLPVLMALGLCAPVAPAAAQRSGDVGAQIEQEYGVVDDRSREGSRLNAQLDEVVERIVQGVNVQSNSRQFRLRSAKILGGRSEKHDKVVNAFALPDGRIYVTLGLMRLIQNSQYRDDELAFVVGHEVTHVAENHSASQMKKSMPISIAALLLGAATRNKAIGQIGGLGAQAYAAKFSRQDEYASDKGGLLAMYHARYNPEAAITMLRRLQQQGGEQNKLVTGWFGSHPLTDNRVERVKEMIDELQSSRDIRNRSENELERDDRSRRRNRNR